MGDRLLK